MRAQKTNLEKEHKAEIAFSEVFKLYFSVLEEKWLLTREEITNRLIWQMLLPTPPLSQPIARLLSFSVWKNKTGSQTVGEAVTLPITILND